MSKKDYEYIKLIKDFQDKKEGEIIKVDQKTSEYFIKQEIGITPEEHELIDEEQYDIIKDFDKDFKVDGEFTLVEEGLVKDKEARKQKMIQALRKSTDYTEILEDFIKDYPIYYDKSRIWWFWDNKLNRWEVTDETELLNIIREALEISGIAKSKTKSEILESLKLVSRKFAPEEPKLEWIQFKNVIVDTKTGEHIKPSSKYFFTNPIDWNLGVREQTPVIDKLFTEWVGEKNKYMLYEIIAYCLYREYPIHRIFTLIGKGRNGKSKYINLLSRFIGTYNSCSTDISILAEKTFESFKLYKKLLCQMGESNYASMKNTGLIKKLSGQDMIGYEKKGKDPFDGYNYAKLVISTNSLPVTHDKTDGFYRRWLIIDFPNQFPEGKDILAQIPDVEYENLAFKSIKILKDLLDRGTFRDELSIADKEKMYEEKSNPLKLFLKEYIEEDWEGYIKKSEFNDKLIHFLKEKGFNQLDNRVINAEMRNLGYNDKQKGEFKHWSWIGIQFKPLLTTSNDSNSSNDGLGSELHMKNQGEGGVTSVTSVTSPRETFLTNWNNEKYSVKTHDDLLNIGFSEKEIDKNLTTGLFFRHKPGRYMLGDLQ